MSTNTNPNSNSNIHVNSISQNSFISTYLRPTPTFAESKKNDKHTNGITYKTLTYNLDSSISKEFNSIYTNKICSVLLKNDCVLFGDFVIEFFSNNTLDFTKTIYAYGELTLRHIIERDLYGKIYTKKVNEYPIYGCTEYKYRCVHDNRVYEIIIYYLNYVQKIDCSFIKDNMILNIDTLTISRKEIKAVSYINEYGELHDQDVPLPLGNLIEDIAKKKFYINTTIKQIDHYNRIILFINTGWSNATSSLLKEKQSTYIGKMCEICHDKIAKGEKIVILKCKHFFHRECWYETLKQNILNNKTEVINCPTCRKSYYIHEVI